jgi:uncharacterized protein with von Willebrand factor type A (vWA) domain
VSDYLRKLMQQGKESLWDDDGWSVAPEVPQSIHAVKHDSFDALTWSVLQDQIGALRDAVHALAEDHGTSEEAQEDVFNLLHQTAPLFRDEAEIKPTHRPQASMLASLAETEEFEQLRDRTVLDEYGTAFAQLCLQEPLREAFDEMSKAQEAQQQAQQALSDAMAQASMAQTEDEQTAAEQALEQALEQQDQADAEADVVAEQQTQGLTDAAEQAKDDLRKEAEAQATYGDAVGDVRTMSFEERRALAEKINKSRLAQLAAIIGPHRFYADAERRRKVKHAPDEVYDVSMGNDLTKLVPGELTNLAVPELEEMFWLRWSKHALLQQEKRGTEKAGMGPVIVVCDESWSMGDKDQPVDDEGNTREAWSKAVSMALADAARRGKRDFTYIGFSSEGQQWQRTFTGGAMTIDDLIEFTSHFFNGGTSYEEPLAMAMNQVEEYERLGKGKADIVLITDDECKVSPSFIDQYADLRRRTETSLYGLQVGEPKFGTLKTLADRTMSITKLTSSPEALRDLYRSI